MKIKEVHSIVKIIGTLVTVGGAMIMTLVNGPSFGLPWTKDNISPAAHVTTPATHQDPIKGALMITAGCLCWASFYILQVQIKSSSVQ